MFVAMTACPDPSRPDHPTAKALLAAGVELFGAHGFAGASTRALAEKAGVNIAAIAYHFGSKEGLREACGRETARIMADDIVGARAAALDAALAAGVTPPQARGMILDLFDAIAPAMLARADFEPVVRFLLREQDERSPAFERIHDGFIAPMHERLCRIWAAATGAAPDASATRLSTLTVVAQIVYFRVARNVALKRMGWTRIGEEEAAQIAAVVRANLRAMLDAAAREARP